MNRAELIKQVCVGFEIAEYSDELRNVHTFSDPAAFERIRSGYSCASCLARFNTYMVRCPLCGNERDVAADIQETAAETQAYWDEANSPGEKTVARPAHEAIRALIDSAELEQVPLKKLRPPRWGAR